MRSSYLSSVGAPAKSSVFVAKLRASYRSQSLLDELEIGTPNGAATAAGIGTGVEPEQEEMRKRNDPNFHPGRWPSDAIAGAVHLSLIRAVRSKSQYPINYWKAVQTASGFVLHQPASWV